MSSKHNELTGHRASHCFVPSKSIRDPQERVTDFIESTLGKIVDDIQNRPCGRPTITFKRITDITPRIDPLSGQTELEILDREVTYSFPGKNKDEAWRFTCVGKILADIYISVKSGVTITKRDIFYRDPWLYRKQATVDRYIDDIAHTCHVTRKDLHVTASARGLVAGLYKPDQLGAGQGLVATVPDFGNELSGTSIQHTKWILVIEKEATFKALAEKDFHRHGHGCGLLVTSKGYPDLATRRFLRTYLDHSCWEDRPRPALLGLFDCDPHGIDILKTYRLGSIKLAHEQRYNLPEMKWLGVKLSDVLREVEDDESVMQLTERDRRKARAMLEAQDKYPEDPLQDQCYMELSRMLMLNKKAEIQLLEGRPGGLEAWLYPKLVEELPHFGC